MILQITNMDLSNIDLTTPIMRGVYVGLTIAAVFYVIHRLHCYVRNYYFNLGKEYLENIFMDLFFGLKIGTCVSICDSRDIDNMIFYNVVIDDTYMVSNDKPIYQNEDINKIISNLDTNKQVKVLEALLKNADSKEHFELSQMLKNCKDLLVDNEKEKGT